MRTFLVTGGAGFIGSHIAEALVSAATGCACSTIFRPAIAANLAHLAKDIEFIEGDIIDAGHVAGRGQGSRLHLSRSGVGLGAAQRRRADGHPRGLRDRYAQRAERSAAVRRAAAGLCRVEQRLRRPADVFQARSRSAGADLALRRRQTRRRILLPCVFGHVRIRDRVHPLFQRVRSAAGSQQPVFGRDPAVHHGHALGRQPTVYGDGYQSRDFTYIDNVVHGNLLAADAAAEQASGRTFNVANGRTTEPAGAVGPAQPTFGHRHQPRARQPRVGDVRESLADITQARHRLQYEPQVTFNEGLRRSIEYYRGLAGK